MPKFIECAPKTVTAALPTNRSGSFFLFWSRGTSESLNCVRLHHNDARTAAAAATAAVVAFVAAATDQLPVVAVAAAAAYDDQLTFIAAVSNYLQLSSMLSCFRVGCCSCLFPIKTPPLHVVK